jgi:FkbM family methyltransferase
LSIPGVRASARRVAAPFLRRLDRIEQRLDEIESSMAREVGLEEVRDGVERRLEGLWSSKVVSLGDRVLVGCRHLDLTYLFPADDRLLMPQFVVTGEYEPATTEYLLRMLEPEGVCLDVGANVGYYTCLMSRLCWRGRVVAFEADPEVHELLRDNVAINWCEQVAEPRNQAVADRSGSLTLYRRVGRSGNTSIIEVPEADRAVYGEPDSVPFEVDCVSVDDVTAELSRLDVVKIDVEGAESLVLRGMRETVQRLDPLVIMEWSPQQAADAGSSSAELAVLIGEMGLRAHVFERGGTLRAVAEEELVGLGYQNIALRRRTASA